jgi:carbamoyl-phosphate synthase small subunit
VAGTPGQRLRSDLGEAELTHVNLYDGTVEGIRLLDVPAGCVQYHPEAGPGPHDSTGLFDDFIGAIARA